MADKPNLNARVHEEDRQRFKSWVKAQQTTDADLFSHLLSAWEAQGGAASLEMPKELIGLQQTLGHVADIVRGIWAQAAAEKKRFEYEAAQTKEVAEEKLQALSATHAQVIADLAALRTAHDKAVAEAREAQAGAAAAQEDRRSLLALTELQAERIKSLEVAEKQAAELPVMRHTLDGALEKLATVERVEQTLRHEKAALEAEVSQLKQQAIDDKQAWQAEQDHLRQALSAVDRELAIFKERSEQLRDRLEAVSKG